MSPTHNPSAHSVLDSISVVIPCYNAATWLPGTVQRIVESLQAADIAKAEIIIVDDGSTDDSASVAEAISAPYPVILIQQPNRGRYLARKAGVKQAKGAYILFIDTRVHLHVGAIRFIAEQLRMHLDRQVWNGHVYPAKDGNVIARFGDAVTFIGWRRYFAHPRTTSYGLDDFDHYPKGTTLFLAPKAILHKAMTEFESTTTDLRHSSDDTLLIRLIARDHRINLSPQFSCTYYARTKFRAFIRHTYFRGQFFVDGFLRPGNRFFWPLVGFLIVSLLTVIVLALKPVLFLVMLAVATMSWVTELVVALSLGLSVADASSLFALSPLFALFYGLGIWRAVIRRYGGV